MDRKETLKKAIDLYANATPEQQAKINRDTIKEYLSEYLELNGGEFSEETPTQTKTTYNPTKRWMKKVLNENKFDMPFYL